MKVRFILFVSLFIILPVILVLADILTTNGTGGGNWNLASSWDGSLTPTDLNNGDTLVIQAGDTITITGNVDFSGVLQIYGVLILDNGRLNMPDTNSVVQLAPGSDIIALNNGQNEYISIGGPSNRISSSYINDELQIPNQLTYGSIGSGGCAVTLDCDENPLPVEVVYFRAGRSDQRVILEWATSFEENFDYFTIERSPDGRIFSEYARIFSKTGLSTRLKTYQYTDEMPFPGRSYYRLLSTDFDGSHDFHGVVGVNMDRMKPDILIYANPTVDGFITVSFNGLHPASFQILNIAGQTIGSGTLQPGINDIRMSPSVHGSIYFFQATVDQGRIMKKFAIR